MGWDAPWHWVILAVVVIALFGYKRLPDASRSLGRSLRIFRNEMKGMSGDDAARSAQHADVPAPAPVAPQTTQPVVAPPPATAPSAAPSASVAQEPSSGTTTTPGTV